MTTDILQTETNHQVDNLTAYELYQLVHYGVILSAEELLIEQQRKAHAIKSEQWVNERLQKIMDDHIGY